MNFTCYSTTDPHSVDVTNIYNSLVDTGSLWNGKPSSIMACSSTRSPASSHCVPCVLDQTLHVICKDIPEKVKLVMEAVGGDIIDLIKADDSCPTFLEADFSGAEVQTGRHVEETAYWVLLGLSVGAVLLLLVLLMVDVSCFFRHQRGLLMCIVRKLRSKKTTTSGKGKEMEEGNAAYLKLPLKEENGKETLNFS